jgi:hypothetical protein
MYIHMYVCIMYITSNTYNTIYTTLCVYLCVFVYLCVCLCVCVCVSLCIYTQRGQEDTNDDELEFSCGKRPLDMTSFTPNASSGYLYIPDAIYISISPYIYVVCVYIHVFPSICLLTLDLAAFTHNASPGIHLYIYVYVYLSI